MVQPLVGFKNVSFKAIDSDLDNRLQSPTGEIRASALYFGTGVGRNSFSPGASGELVAGAYPDSDTFTNSSTPMYTEKPPKHDAAYLGYVISREIVGLTHDAALKSYLDSTAPDGYKYGDIDKSGDLSSADYVELYSVAGRQDTSPDFSTNISTNLQERIDYWVGKGGGVKMPGFNGINMSMFKGMGNMYANVMYQEDQPYLGGSPPSGLDPVQDADGFGYRVKIIYPTDQTNSFFTPGMYILASNPFQDSNRGCVQIWRIDRLDKRMYHVGTVYGENTGDYFGYSLEGDDKYFVVGAPFYSTSTGRAYVFQLTSETSYKASSQAGLLRTLTAPATGKYYGSAVAIKANIDRVAVGDQTIQYSNDATYGYQIGKVKLATFKSSYTQIAYFDNPDPVAFGLSTPANNVINFGIGGAFNSPSAAYDDGTINYTEGDFLPSSQNSKPYKTLTFSFTNELLVSGFGGYSLDNNSRVYAFDADGTYLYKAGGTSTTYTDTYGRNITGDSDYTLLSSHHENNFGGEVYLLYRGGATFGTKDNIRHTEVNTLQDWGYNTQSNMGTAIALGKKYVAFTSEYADNATNATDDFINVFQLDSANTFNSLYKTFCLTSAKNSNGDDISEANAYIRVITDIDIGYNESDGTSYLVAGVPLLSISNNPTTYKGAVLVWNLDNVTDITVTGEEPTA